MGKRSHRIESDLNDNSESKAENVSKQPRRMSKRYPLRNQKSESDIDLKDKVTEKLEEIKMLFTEKNNKPTTSKKSRLKYKEQLLSESESESETDQINQNKSVSLRSIEKKLNFLIEMQIQTKKTQEKIIELLELVTKSKAKNEELPETDVSEKSFEEESTLSSSNEQSIESESEVETSEYEDEDEYEDEFENDDENENENESEIQVTKVYRSQRAIATHRYNYFFIDQKLDKDETKHFVLFVNNNNKDIEKTKNIALDLDAYLPLDSEEKSNLFLKSLEKMILDKKIKVSYIAKRKGNIIKSMRF